MSSGFSFACPHLARKDTVFRRFLDAAPEDISNPWPELAGLISYEQARSQPLFRVIYVPTAQLDQYGSTLDKEIERQHELFHIQLDFSPAKVWARALLMPGYYNLGSIMEAEDWNSEQQNAWETLGKLNDQLRELFASSSLSEELLVTAFSFDAAQYKLNIAPASLKPIEERHIAYYVEGFRSLDCDIEALYYKTFKKLAHWMGEEGRPNNLPLLVSAFLQGISLGSEDKLEVVDSNERCNLLHENIQNIKESVQLVDWLSNATPTEEIEAQLAAQGTLLSFTAMDEWPWGQLIWIVARGKRAPQTLRAQVIRNPLKAVGKLRIVPPLRTSCLLFIEELSEKWYIRRWVIEGQRKRLLADSIVQLLALDSIRQQLLKGSGGLCCPHYTPGRCVCQSTSSRQLMARLSQWAKEGKFGRWENWKDLPQECRSPV